MNKLFTITITSFICIAIILPNFLFAAPKPKNIKKVNAVCLNNDISELETKLSIIETIVESELMAIDSLEVLAKNEIKDILTASGEAVEKTGLGKTKLLNLGEKLKAEYVLSGNLSKQGENIVVIYNLYHVPTKTTIKVQKGKFIYNEKLIPDMIKVTIQQLFGQKVNKELMTKLTEESAFETALNNPEANTVVRSGPRIGLVYVAEGTHAYNYNKVLTGPEYKVVRATSGSSETVTSGFFDKAPLFSTFGWQFEYLYLNLDRLQAFMNITPMLVGIEQKMFGASCSFYTGLRDNKTGFDFGLGINVIIANKGTYTDDWGNPILGSESLKKDGDPRLDYNIMFSFGKTFVSGKLNIPVNFQFTLPNKYGFFMGVSTGFNIVSKKIQNVTAVEFAKPVSSSFW